MCFLGFWCYDTLRCPTRDSSTPAKTCCRLPDTRRRTRHTRRHLISAIRARARPVVAQSNTRCRPILHPMSPDPIPVVSCCVPVVAQIFLTCVPIVARVFLTCVPVVAQVVPVVGRLYPSSQTAYLSLRPLTSRCKIRDSSSRPIPHPPRTCPRQPYKYARARSFLCTLSEHPGLHLPQQLLAGFLMGC